MERPVFGILRTESLKNFFAYHSRIAETTYGAVIRHQLTDDRATETDTKELHRPIVTIDITKSAVARPQELMTGSVFSPQVSVQGLEDSLRVQGQL